MRLLSEIRNYMDNYHVKSGVYHYYRKEYGEAVSFLRKALADESGLSDAERRSARSHLALSLKELGEKLASEGEVEAGVQELRRAANVDPRYPDIHFLLAGLLERAARREEAIEAYRRAIDCHPGYLDAHVGLANCLLAAARADEAAEVFRRALELKLDEVRRPFHQGLEALGTGDEASARRCFHEAFRASPQLSREYLKKALEWIRAEEYERALDSLDRALELNPKYPDLHNFRGIALCEMERFDEAATAFRRSTELCPSHLVPRLNLAFAFLRAGRLDEAEEGLRAVLRQDPDEPVARARLEELRAARLGDKRGQGARS
jgi:tetratricopeptide (TPR) repeat protein